MSYVIRVTVAVYTFYYLTLSSVSNVTFTACVQFNAEGIYADVPKQMYQSLTLRLLMSYIYIYMEHLFLMFLDHTQRRTTVGRTPLDK